MEATEYLEKTTMRTILDIPAAALDHVMAKAYQLYVAGRHAEVEILCRGLIAADHRYWWSYSLYAAALRKLGLYREALVQIDRGLVFEPGQPKLLRLRAEIAGALERRAAGKAAPAPIAGEPVMTAASREAAQIAAF